MGLNRRDFLKVTGLQAGVLAAGAGSLEGMVPLGAADGAPAVSRRRPEIVVVGAGAFGVWTAYNLKKMGVDVLLIDQYGPGNSRATSGGETRGVRTGYRDRELWTRWASRAIERWNEWNERWMDETGLQLFFPTGDLAIREEWDNYTTTTRETWEKLGIRHEVLDPDEIRYRWPQINTENISFGLYEYDAGVVRARKVCEKVSDMYEQLGGRIEIGRVRPGRSFGGRLVDVVVEPGGDRISADSFIFALGPWFGKMFPEHMEERMRIPLGHVFYYGIPPGDNRFRHPNMPSYNVPSCTGWPALPPDSKGLRVRTGGREPEDPDESQRYIPGEFLEDGREILRKHFPDLADAPLIETRACHYESTANRDWLIDHHPDMENVWLFGGGNAEGFKFSVLLGEYMAQRATGEDPYADVSDRWTMDWSA